MIFKICLRELLLKGVLVQTDPSEKIDLLTQEAYKGFLTFLSPIRCPLLLTNFSKLFHVS